MKQCLSVLSLDSRVYRPLGTMDHSEATGSLQKCAQSDMMLSCEIKKGHSVHAHYPNSHHVDRPDDLCCQCVLSRGENTMG